VESRVTTLTLGDAVASDTIWRGIQLARGLGTPVVASFGDVAASGGYYAAAAADMIYSNQYTITGSIGVIAAFPVIKRLLNMVDVTSDSIQFLPNAAWRHMELGLPETELKKLSAHIDSIYELFKRVVSEGRGMNMDRVEQLAQGQVYTGAQAHRLGLVDHIGSLHEALGAAALCSLDRSGLIKLEELHEERPEEQIREIMGDEMKKIFDDAMVGGNITFKAVKEQILGSPHFQNQPEPTAEEIQSILNRKSVIVRPAVQTVIIPHVNLANEALGMAISSAFQSDEERSPIPIDLPLVNPDKDDNPTQGKIIVGALLGIARSNGVPLWQFPMFCYWWAAQAAGNVGDGMMGGFMDKWFRKLMSNEQGFIDTAHMFAGTAGPRFTSGRAGWTVRMEMPPLQILL
jgi:signal peptide peptidase SppA